MSSNGLPTASPASVRHPKPEKEITVRFLGRRLSTRSPSSQGKSRDAKTLWGGHQGGKSQAIWGPC